jgi:hypothetical protein
MFSKHSAFNQDQARVRELFRKTEDAIHREEHAAGVLIPHNQLEEWYTSLDELARYLDVPREHIVASSTVLTASEAIEQLRDEVYRYLRG